MGAQPSRFHVETQESSVANISGITDATRSDPILQAHNMMDDPPMEERRQSQERVFDDKNDEPSSPRTRQAIQIALGALLCSTILTLFVFLILFGKRAGNNNNDDEEDRGGPDEERSKAGKLTFALLWMLLAAVGLAVVGCLAFWKGIAIALPSRYRAGLLAGSLLGYAKLALVCTLFFWNHAEDEEEDSRDRYLESNQDDDNAQEEQQNGSLPFAILCIVLCSVYTILAAIVIWKHSSIITEETTGPDPTGTVSPDEQTMTKSAATADLLSDAWGALCCIGIVAVTIALIVAPLALLQEDAERVREEGEIWNYIAVIAWVLIILCILYMVGRDVFGQRKTTSQVAIGALNGELFYFAALAFLVAVFYTSMSLGRDRRPEDEEGTLGSGGFAVTCFFLAGIFGAFAVGVAKHHKNLIRANAKDIYSVEQWREPFMCGDMT